VARPARRGTVGRQLAHDRQVCEDWRGATNLGAEPCWIDSSADWESLMAYADEYLREVQQVVERLDRAAIEEIADRLVATRDRGGRVFVLGVGGGAGNASHAVCDLRKLAGLEAYTPLDNVSELTAQINDNGWEWALANWLRESRISGKDLVFVFSVGGGSLTHNISPNLVRALQLAHEVGASIVGVVGRDGGYTATVADAYVIVPTVNAATITPHTVAFQAVVWHLLVSHPRVQVAAMKWESVAVPGGA
jgi:D-sedoheptulose 7-phosphate isomerase